MKNFCLKSISFPSIGTGAQGYPPALVASVMLETVFKYICSNKDNSATINIVIYEKDFHIIAVN